MAMFDPPLPRLATKVFKQVDGDEHYLEIGCYNCACRSFAIVAARSDRHYRIVCDNCGRIQPEYIGLYLGVVHGVS